MPGSTFTKRFIHGCTPSLFPGTHSQPVRLQRIPGGIGSGTANETVNLIGAFSDLKDPAPGQSQPREANLLIVSEHLRGLDLDGTRRSAIRTPDEG